MFTIRVATPAAAADIARVQIETWRSAYRDLIPAAYLSELSIERRAETHRVYLERHSLSVETFVAESDAGVIGYCSCGRSRDSDAEDEGEIFAIYVLESFAGQGVGASLIRRAEEWFREQRFSRACLWVLEGNRRARVFYRHMGWEETGSVKDEDIGGIVVREAEYRKTFPAM